MCAWRLIAMYNTLTADCSVTLTHTHTHTHTQMDVTMVNPNGQHLSIDKLPLVCL